MTIYSLDVLLSWFETSLLFHPVLTVATWPAYRSLRQVRWSGIPFKSFPQFVVIPTVKDFGIVSKAEVDFFLELSCFFDDPTDVVYLISDSSTFSKSSFNNWNSWFMYCWTLAWRMLSITLLYVWNKCNYAVVWTFFGIAFLWDWNENWPFPVLWPLLSFPNLLAYDCSSLTASSLGIWNSSAGFHHLH